MGPWGIKNYYGLEISEVDQQRPMLTINDSQEMGSRPILKLLEPDQVMFF